jgi:hypothetical protein
MASNELTSVREVIISAEGVREVIFADEQLAKSFEFAYLPPKFSITPNFFFQMEGYAK